MCRSLINKQIRLSKSCINSAEKQAVMGVLNREFLGMGAEVQQFEQALSIFFGRQAVCVANGTAALHLAVQACGIGAGDEVLVQSLTYVASFQAISATGAKPVACDVEPTTLTLDLKDAENRITPRTKAVMPVHYAGGVGDIDGIYEFARRHGLRVIEDAAHAFGTQHKGVKVGGSGDVSCFSFDGIKNITSGEGGCIVSSDEELISRTRDARLLGVKKDTEQRYTESRSWEFDVSQQGWRYHMSNIMAAIGLEQLKRFPEMAKKRQALAKHYDSLLCSHDCISLFAHDYEAVVPHIYTVRINGMKDRKALQAKMLEKGIQTGYHYQPNHWLSLYSDKYAAPYPATEEIFPEILSLPLHCDLLKSDIEFVASELKKILQINYKYVSTLS